MTAPNVPSLGAYRRIILAFSGGKDRPAALLHLPDLSVTPDRIESHHHEIDGQGPTFMDCPCTPAYANAVAAYFGIAV
jgi:hypothetical protein